MTKRFDYSILMGSHCLTCDVDIPPGEAHRCPVEKIIARNNVNWRAALDEAFAYARSQQARRYRKPYPDWLGPFVIFLGVLLLLTTISFDLLRSVLLF